MVFPDNRKSEVDPDSQNILISVNPNAGAKSSREAVEKLAQLLLESGFEVEISSDLDFVEKRSQELLDTHRLRAVVAAGGDGTASLIAAKTPRGTPIAILPQGTENLLAKYLCISTDPVDIAQLIKEGITIELDAGKANGRLFLIMLGCGFDAEVVRRLDEARSGHIHHLTYAKPILQSIFNYDYPDIRIEDLEAKQQSEELKAKWAFVINLPRYAVGLQLAPSATGTDEMLDLCAFREGSFLSGLTYLTGVLLGQHESWEDCLTKKARRFRLSSESKVPYQIDGDPGGYLPVEVEIVPRRLKVFAPLTFLESYQD